MKFRFIVFALLAVLAFAPVAPLRAQGSGVAGSYSQAELDQMLAPIALYPDGLLAQVLTAATYPLELVQASRWSLAHADLTGTDASDAAADQNWDPSVKALLAFPNLLDMMNDKLDWTQSLGAAFMGQQAQVMDTIQSLRQKAEAAGTLNSGGELNVSDDNSSIDIEPASPDMVYLPYYDPNTAYGTWPWPAYPPVYWNAWPTYGWSGGFAWGSGVTIGTGFFVYDFDWRKRRINVYDHGRPWHRYGYYDGGNDRPHAWQHTSTYGSTGYLSRPDVAATAAELRARRAGGIGGMPAAGMALSRDRAPAPEGYQPGRGYALQPQRNVMEGAPVMQGLPLQQPHLQQPHLEQPHLQSPMPMHGSMGGSMGMGGMSASGRHP